MEFEKDSVIGERKKEIIEEIKDTEQRLQELADSLIKKEDNYDIKTTTYFKDKLEDIIVYIGKIEQTLEAVKGEKRRVYTDIEEDMLHVFSNFINLAGYGTLKEFQIYLANLAEEYFWEWKNERGIEYKYRIKVKYPGRLNTPYVITLDDQELIQFNIMEKWYGIKDKGLPEDVVRNTMNRFLEDLQDEEREEEEQLALWMARRDKPWKHSKGISNKIYLLFTKREVVYQELDDKVNNHFNRLKNVLTSIERHKQLMKKNIDRNRKKLDGEKLLYAFFASLGYKEL